MFWVHGNVGFLCGCLLLLLLLRLTLPRSLWLSIHEKQGSESSQYQRQEVALNGQRTGKSYNRKQGLLQVLLSSEARKGVDIYAEPVPW